MRNEREEGEEEERKWKCEGKWRNEVVGSFPPLKIHAALLYIINAQSPFPCAFLLLLLDLMGSQTIMSRAH